MNLFSGDMLLIILMMVGAYLMATGITARFKYGNDATWTQIVFLPYHLAKRPVRSFWRHVRSPKPPNRTKA